MKLSALVYAAYFLYYGTHDTNIPDRCRHVTHQENRIKTAQELTGHHTPQADKTLEILEKISEILHCNEREAKSPRYEQQINKHRKQKDITLHGNGQYLRGVPLTENDKIERVQRDYPKNMYCPDVRNYLDLAAKKPTNSPIEIKIIDHFEQLSAKWECQSIENQQC